MFLRRIKIIETSIKQILAIDFLIYSFQIGKAYDIESYVLSPEETKKLYPLMNVSDLYGTLYSPGDGTIDPAGWAASLSKAATLRGAKASVS